MPGIAPKIPRLLGVVGAGQMGAGIAQVAAMTGVPVVLVDLSQASLDNGMATINRSLAKLIPADTSQSGQKNANAVKELIRTSVSLKVFLAISGLVFMA